MATLRDYIKIKHGYAFKGKNICTVDNNVVLVTPGNFAISGGFKEEKCKYFVGEYPSDYVLKADDLIVTMTDLSKEIDTLGYSALVPHSDNGKVYLHNQRIGLVKIKTDEIDKHYLYWFMRSPYYQKIIAATSTGSTVHHTSPDRIMDIEIELPELEKQKKIAAFLDNIEDKININININKNLEQQAQTIFEEEFLSLDFIPSTWKKNSLLEIATYLNGLAMQKFRPSKKEKGLPVLKIKELRQGMCDSNSDLCSPTIKSEYIIHNGDVIFSWSGSLLVDFWCGGICGLNQHLFKVSSMKYDKWFYYSWTNYHLQKFIAIAADKATTMGHIKREDLSKASVLIPSHEDYIRIGGLLKPIYNLIIENRLKNVRLTSLRDTLLPKLMSGEIDVSNIDF